MGAREIDGCREGGKAGGKRETAKRRGKQRGEESKEERKSADHCNTRKKRATRAERSRQDAARTAPGCTRMQAGQHPQVVTRTAPGRPGAPGGPPRGRHATSAVGACYYPCQFFPTLSLSLSPLTQSEVYSIFEDAAAMTTIATRNKRQSTYSNKRRNTYQSPGR